MFKKEKYFEKTPVADYLKSMNDLGYDGQMLVPIIASDDGYAQINMAWLELVLDGESVVARIMEDQISAIAKRGQHLNAAMGGATHLYGVEEGGVEYSVHPYIFEPEDTRRAEYATSELNLCLIHAGLDRLGLAGEKVALLTGLPLEECLDGESGFNEMLISRKVKNLRRKVYVGKSGNPSAEVVFAGVYPEALAGMMDYMLDEYGNLRDGVEENVARLAIDIGGNTTDLAIVLPGGVVGEKLTLKQGVKHVKDKLRLNLMKRFDYEPDDMMLEQALKTCKVSWFGGLEEDVTPEVENAVDSVMSPLTKQIDAFKKKIPSLREIVGFGGGVALMEDLIREKNPNIIIIDNPAGANARGFLKSALLYSFDEIMADVERALNAKVSTPTEEYAAG
ncbi:ParM/StbA family protein [Neptuniibacter halophilus]|uniref:ParM/StbA family protein n=1 Tax=Neptuniibacter halophilus TaxID=651666 RepID=UPI002573036D|nr:ParM/StbA family protein [Neptuniibacter halophilus]